MVRQAVEIVQRERIEVEPGIRRHRRPFGAAGHRTREMKPRGGFGAAGQDETFERIERIVHADWVIVEGIHLLAAEELRGLFDVSVFMHSDEALRLGRRMIRDVESRGRTPRSVLAQFFTHVRAMHETYVEPQRALADMVIVCPFEAGPAHADASAAQIAERLA